MKPIRVLALAAVSAVGCVSVDPRGRFASVEQSVAERATYRIHWHTGGEADRAVADEVDALLAKPLTLDEAVQVALLNNRRLQATYEDLGIAQADLVEAGLLKNPVFDGSVRFLEGGGHSPTIDLGIAFDFLDVFLIGLRKNLAAAQLEAAEARVTAAVLDLAAQAKAAYVEVQAAQQMLELARQAESATAVTAELAKRLHDAGNIRSLDLANERALHEESMLAVSRAETDLAERRERLNQLMGVAAAAWTIDARLAEPPDQPVDVADLDRRSIDASLDLRAARAEIEVGRRELGITKPLGVLSELELGATAERDDGEWEVGPSLATPIPIFSQGQPAVARATARLRQAEHRYAATMTDIRASVRAVAARTQGLAGQANRYRTIVLPLRQSIVQDTQLQFNAMQVGGFELLQAKRDQIDAARRYVQTLRDYWLARTDLDLLASGRLPAMAASNANESAEQTSTPDRGGH